MTRRIAMALVAMLLAVSATAASQDGVRVELALLRPVVQLGEPFDLTVYIHVELEAGLITDNTALTASTLWPYLEIHKVAEDGTEVPISLDRPVLAPLPSSLWINRNGESLPVRPAVVLNAGDVIEVPIVNLLRYFSIAAPGTYRLSLSYELPVYETIVTNPLYEDQGFVVEYEGEWLATDTTPLEFTLERPDGESEETIDWFRDAREALFLARNIVDAIEPFESTPDDAPTEFVRACSQYWIGEAYQLFWIFDEAMEAYHRVIDEFPNTIFAAYAQARLAELVDTQSD